MRTLLGVLLLTLALTACDSGAADETRDPAYADQATTQVTVAFRDSSVPPAYHRSWELALDADTIRVVVDSYGDVLAEESVSMPAEAWERFTADLPVAVEGLGKPEPLEPGCAGGTGITLVVDGSLQHTTEVDNCSSRHNQRVTDAILALVKPFTDEIRLDELIAAN